MTRGILFSADMVRALRSGLKTQTRRIIQPRPTRDPYTQRLRYVQSKKVEIVGEHDDAFRGGMMASHPQLCRYGTAGDRLRVRESFSISRDEIIYHADGERRVIDLADPEVKEFVRSHENGPRISALHMPAWASRIVLAITEVRIQRITEISAEDCVAEGIELAKHKCGCDVCWHASKLCAATQSSLIEAFAQKWNYLNAERGFPWQNNDFVWAISFVNPCKSAK